MNRLCLDARMLHASGIGTYLQNLLPALASAFKLTLLGHPEELSGYPATVIPTDIPIYSIPEIIRFPSLVPRCDIFWSPHYNIPLLPVKAKKRLVTIHDVYHLAYLDTLSMKQRIYAKVMMQTAIKKSQHIITVSQFSKKEIIKYCGALPDKISVIHNGVDHQHFKKLEDKRLLQTVREKYQLPKQFILFVGNVKPHKNLINLVKAFAKVKEKIPDISLVIVGKKDGFITSESDVLPFINQDQGLTGRIIFTGFVDDQDLPVIYNLARLFVFPSLYEGFGLPPLEAMACGCPVLVSDRASMPEVCGEYVNYFSPTDIESIAGGLLEKLPQPEAEKQPEIQNGLARAQTFTWQQSTQAHIDLIRQLA